MCSRRSGPKSTHPPTTTRSRKPTRTASGLADFAPKRSVSAHLHHADGTTEAITLNQTTNAEQIEWLKAESALNVLKKQTVTV
jgi:aconitase A